MGLRDLLPENFYLGTGINKCTLFFNPEMQDLVANNFNSIIPPSNMKRRAVYEYPDTFKVEPIDWLVNFCRDRNMTLRGHCFVTRTDYSDWIAALDETEASKHLLNYITEICSRYRGMIPFYDVAVEAVGSDGSLLNCFWMKKLGPDYVHKAFSAAHQADPDALLFYSDYALHDHLKLAGVFRLINSIRDSGIPVHGLAIQAHHHLSGSFKLRWLKRVIRSARSEGLIPHVSEVTLWANSGLPDLAGQIAQGHFYEKILDLCLEEGVNFLGQWSCCDKFVWRYPEKTPGWWDENLKPKKAYHRIEKRLQKNLAEAKTE